MERERILDAFAVGNDVGVRYRGETVLVMPAQAARELGLKPGKWRILPAGADEAGHWILRSGEGKAMIFRQPPEKDGLFWSASGLIRSMCWDIFGLATGVDLEFDAFAKFRLVPA